ncbi:hypothetical protein DCAR_0105138 [Daucus carota subsp. sativus]|uniref:3-dehydroquinate synthase C-terminal domain-containing protein n=1 Tax=Daucus carota subsp. sativus TaxID=79200 RepID=A0AAF0WDC8_DAUCS|nr:hypothetical protein DCAR_0105138 [Daucus carota subsp. sativus]
MFENLTCNKANISLIKSAANAYGYCNFYFVPSSLINATVPSSLITNKLVWLMFSALYSDSISGPLCVNIFLTFKLSQCNCWHMNQKILSLLIARVLNALVSPKVDSSVGGKTGVNHRLGKNLIGTIYQPQSVLIDTDTLNTLSERELHRNISPMNLNILFCRYPDALAYAIKRSCEIKADIVCQDEMESEVRATLNLGHTFGHAIENICGYGEWLHGEAVAVGTLMAVDMSYHLGWIDNSVVERANKIIKQAKLPTRPPANMTAEMFKSAMALDKKVADGVLRLVLLKGPLGNCVFTGDYDRKALDETLHAFCKS